MKHLFYCHYEYTVTPKGNPQRNYEKGILPFRERDYIVIESEEYPSRQIIKEQILAMWKYKNITNCDIYEIFSPEKVY